MVYVIIIINNVFPKKILIANILFYYINFKNKMKDKKFKMKNTKTNYWN